MVVLKCDKVKKSYGKKPVLKDLSLEINQGDIYGLIGVNGVGKSTLLKAVLGLTKINEGKIELFESDNLTLMKKQVGSMLDSNAFFSNMTVIQNLTYFEKMFDIQEDLEKLLEKVGLENNQNDKFSALSLGMKQRLGIALAIMKNPKLVILDEPLNGLDPLGIVDIRQLILDLSDQYGISFLISSHNLPELEQTATKFGIMKDGTVVNQLSADQLSQVCQKGHMITLKKSLGSKLQKEIDGLCFRNTIKIPGNINPSELVDILKENEIEIEKIEDYELSLEDYFRYVIR